MSGIAPAHGATVDKSIGDAILGFFGDPETQGVAPDARACVEMAAAMQRRLGQLNDEWRKRGVEQPFRARIGINTGYCNVGNSGSDDRMACTIIGAEATLAARLQTIAEPNGIVLGYGTCALVRDLVRAHPLAPIRMKGISREVVPYAVEGLLGKHAQRSRAIGEHAQGLDLFIDLDIIDEKAAERTRHRCASSWTPLTGERSPPDPEARARRLWSISRSRRGTPIETDAKLDRRDMPGSAQAGAAPGALVPSALAPFRQQAPSSGGRVSRTTSSSWPCRSSSSRPTS